MAVVLLPQKLRPVPYQVELWAFGLTYLSNYSFSCSVRLSTIF